MHRIPSFALAAVVAGGLGSLPAEAAKRPIVLEDLSRLREVSDPDGRPIEIIWDGVAVLRSLDKPTYVAVRELLREVDEERSDLTVTIVDR